MTQTLIHGESGPFAPDTPGAYGRNAAHNFMLAEHAAIAALSQGEDTLWQQLRDTPIRYSPAHQLRFDDAFAYVEEEIKRFDAASQDGKLDLTELTALFGGHQEIAQQYLTVLDRDGDGKVGVVEYTAFLLFSDDATNLLAETLTAFQLTGATQMFSPQELKNMVETAHWLKANYPTRLDGEITSHCKRVADMAVLTMGNLTALTLDSIIANLNLPGRYAQFKSQSN